MGSGKRVAASGQQTDADGSRLTASCSVQSAISNLKSLLPALDAQTLLAHITGRNRAWLLAHPEAELTPTQIRSLEEARARLSEGVPLPYILGHWEFYGLDFRLTPDVLIPRPETELLVEQALSVISNQLSVISERLSVNSEQLSVSGNRLPTTAHRLPLTDHRSPLTAYRPPLTDHRSPLIADIGTGSGCIAVALAVHAPEARLIAVDISAAALQVARENARKHQVADRIHFVQADLLAPFAAPSTLHAPRFTPHLICANLPYIPAETLHQLEVYGREPTLALDGGEDGLTYIRRLMAQAVDLLAPGGVLLLEIESTQGTAALSLARRFLPDAEITLLPDLAGHDRLLKIQQNPR